MAENNTTNTAVAKKETKVLPPAAQLKNIIKGDAFKGAVSAFFEKEQNRDRFVQAAINAIVRVPKLGNCDRNSFMMALMQLAQMGLNPDGRNAHLIPYGTNVTLVVDYKGMVTLAMRSDKVSKVEAFEVYKNDHFRLKNGEVEHEVDDPFGDRGEVVGFYAVCQFKDGTKKYEVMSKKQVDAVRARSRASQNGPWVTDYNEMAKKTVFKRLSKWLPVTPDLQAAIDKDDEEYANKHERNFSSERSGRVTASDLLGGRNHEEPEENGEIIEGETVED